MFKRNIPTRLQNVAKCRAYKMSQNRGLRNYQRGGNLKKGEVNFERGGSDPLGNYEGMCFGYKCVWNSQNQSI